MHVNLISLWLCLTTVLSSSTRDMYKARSLYGGYYWILRLPWTLCPLMYQCWLIWYIYDQWAQHLIMVAKILYTLPVIALLNHTLCQMYFLVTTNSVCRSKDSVYRFFILINGVINTVMLVHLTTIIIMVCHQHNSTSVQWIGFVFEMLYRGYALYKYGQLYIRVGFLEKESNGIRDNELIMSPQPHMRCSDNDETYPYLTPVVAQAHKDTSLLVLEPLIVVYKEGCKKLSSLKESILSVVYTTEALPELNLKHN